MNPANRSMISFAAFRSEFGKPEHSDPWFSALRQVSAASGGVGALQDFRAQGQLVDRLYRYGGDWAVWPPAG